MERSEEAARVLIFLAGVVEGEPADGPGHAAFRATAGEGLTARKDCRGAVGGGLVLSDGAVGGDLNLIHAHDRDVGEEASAQKRWGGRQGEPIRPGRSKAQGGCGARVSEELSPGPLIQD